MDQKQALITLAETLAHHQGVSHYAISMRALGKGDFFKNLMRPDRDCRTRTAARLFQWFSDNWDDESLEWPEGIPRPDKTAERQAGAA